MPVRGRVAPRRLARIPDALLERKKASGRLGWLLAWAVVFADIGTSIYYVPGLLFRELGGTSPSPAAAFVAATGLVFVLLALKYVDVAARYPDGGGVVSVASDAFGPFVGCIGGILICVDYFLTGALSSVSGFQYLAAEIPALTPYIAPTAENCCMTRCQRAASSWTMTTTRTTRFMTSDPTASTAVKSADSRMPT